MYEIFAGNEVSLIKNKRTLQKLTVPPLDKKFCLFSVILICCAFHY